MPWACPRGPRGHASGWLGWGRGGRGATVQCPWPRARGKHGGGGVKGRAVQRVVLDAGGVKVSVVGEGRREGCVEMLWEGEQAALG